VDTSRHPLIEGYCSACKPAEPWDLDRWLITSDDYVQQRRGDFDFGDIGAELLDEGGTQQAITFLRLDLERVDRIRRPAFRAEFLEPVGPKPLAQLQFRQGVAINLRIDGPLDLQVQRGALGEGGGASVAGSSIFAKFRRPSFSRMTSPNGFEQPDFLECPRLPEERRRLDVHGKLVPGSERASVRFGQCQPAHGE